MRRHLLLLTICVLAGQPALAQVGMTRIGAVTTEVFAGASYLRSGITNGPQDNLAGWQGAIDYNIVKHVGMVLDLGGQYRTENGTTLSLYQYMLGPRFKFRSRHITVFVHGLVGGDASHVPGSTRGAFAAALGGGLDVNVGKLVAIRLFQVDWINDHSRGVWSQNVRGAVGVVFKIPHVY